VRGRTARRSLHELSLDALAPDVRGRVATAREAARRLGTPLYLVGGAVRDILLGRPVADVDLMVPADAAAFARHLASALGGRARFHGRFGTATVDLPGGARVDVATARREDYVSPGALPRVSPGSVTDDLARRDFTVNAMAAEIAGAREPVLLDPFGGREDLRRGRIRALHGRSFADDPTRAFRAVRYANRLGFRIDPATRSRIRAAASGGAVDTISADRLRREVALLFAEPGGAAAARELSRLGLYRAIHPALRYDAATGRRLREAESRAAREPATSWLVYLLSWMGAVSEPAARAIAARLNLSRVARDRVAAWPTSRQGVLRASEGRPGALAEVASRLDPDTLIAVAAAAPRRTREAILAARSTAPGFRLTIRGADLIAAGVPPGPAIGRALASTRAARREGVLSPEGELAFALRAAKR
jgi:tRNA nucleotidyltransferase (CCA-adding enzyme)